MAARGAIVRGAMGPGELADLAGKKAEELTAEEIERLMSNPQIRELQYKLAHGGDSFKLEVTNEAPREVRNVRVPEGASEGERAEAVRAAMAEQQRNEQRDADAAARRKRKEHEELMARSDAWAYVLTGAGTEGVNGRYARNGEGVKNGARVYVGPNGFSLTREVVDGGEGWIVGKTPRAYYAYQTSDTMAPSTGWAVQEHGEAPAPTVVAIEPVDAVESAKSEGNTAFGEGDYAAAVRQYTIALSIASACASAHGMDETLLGKIHANRAEVPRYSPRLFAETDADALFPRCLVVVAGAPALGEFRRGRGRRRDCSRVRPVRRQGVVVAAVVVAAVVVARAIRRACMRMPRCCAGVCAQGEGDARRRELRGRQSRHRGRSRGATGE